MKTMTLWVAILCLALSANGQSATSIIQQYQKATAINDLSSELTYTNVSKTGRTQTRSLRQYILRNAPGKNTYNFLLEFMAPQDVAGTATLTIQHQQRDDDQWLYLPVLRTSKRISAGRKGDRFMGTEMTYEDLSNYLSEPLEEYSYQLLGKENINGRSAYRLSATPKSGTKTQYSKRTLWIDQQTHLMLRTDFYDQKGKLLKVFTAQEIKKIAGTNFYRAHRVRLDNKQSGNRTDVTYKGFAINRGVDKGLFSKTYLETK